MTDCDFVNLLWLSGTVYDITQSYFMSFFFAGVLILAAGLVSCAIPWVVRRQKNQDHYADDDQELGKMSPLSVVREEQSEESAAEMANTNTNNTNV